jgi:hypothetical protein
MKTTSAFLLVIAALLSTARADLTIVQQVEGAGPLTQMTMKIKGDKARIEATPQVISIVDSKSGEMLSLLHDQKMVMRMSAAQAKAAAAAMGAQLGGQAGAQTPPAKVTVKPTGNKETINGYEAEEYYAETAGYKASYWIARNYPQGDAILKQLQAMTPEAWNAGAMGTPDFRDLPGLPIRTNATIGDMKIVTTVKEVKLDPLPDAEFAVPAGYKEMKLPDMGSMMGAPGAGKAAKPTASPKQ